MPRGLRYRGVDSTPEMVAQASRLSQLKAIFSTLSLGLLLVLILAWAFRRW